VTAAHVTVSDAPFPHAVLEDWWPAELLRAVAAEFPPADAPGWRRYDADTERKLEGPPGLWGPRTRELFALLESRTPMLEQLSGIDGLRMETIGGGYHLIPPGGHLQVHADFNRSPATGRWRRLNVLVYLNEDWTDPGGHLELWDGGGPAVDIVPEFGRTVMFATSATSWHGHPKPAARERRSVAAYFFTDAPPAGAPEVDRSTVWHPGVS
jgi:hypothetical protein